uniref:Trigger factor n=1 Tax=Candidatus Kentrum sp. DK TaxID=2126562 RepID=A0A450SZ01_9GAMM|nr:MAG: trigger factor [Candidatus Kentron sp. DK]VFJ59253.1 MAG: trigger factor [Candidatus Kentron sp. DK]
MHVTVDNTEGLTRRMRVEIPEDRIANLVNERLQSLASSISMPGFRPGKVPVKLVARRYGDKVKMELLERLLPETFQQAAAREKLVPANMPEFNDVDIGSGNGLVYTVVFQVFPDLQLPDLETLEIQRPMVEVTDEDVDKMVETLREQCKTWSTVARPAAKGDRVVVDFEGIVGSRPAEESAQAEEKSDDGAASGEDAEAVADDTSPEPIKRTGVGVELGAGKMIEGFEDGLLDASADEERILELKFPDTYHNRQLAGCPVTFTVRVKSVEEASLPETDEDFAGRLGIGEGTMEAIRNAIREDLNHKREFALREKINGKVITALLEKIGEIELPESAIERESTTIAEKKRSEFKQIGIDPDSLGINPANFREEARRRLIFSLLLGRLMNAANVTVDPGRVLERVRAVSAGYQDPKQMIAWYYEDKSRLAMIESVVLQDQLVEWVLEKANVTEEPLPLTELLTPQFPK